jgi:hypothetical protein
MIMKVSANLIVQFLASSKSPNKSSFDWLQVLEFAVYGFIGSQVGNIVQFQLENWFPTGTPQGSEGLPVNVKSEKPQQEKKSDDSSTGEKSRNCLRISPDLIWRNVVAKLILDQTLGLFVSGCVFLVCTNLVRVPHPFMVLDVIREKIFPLIKAGWHIWPLVSICNFLWVPVRSRVLVAVFVGFGWSVFLSIFASRK